MRADAAGGTKHMVGRVLALPRAEKQILTDVDAFLDALDRHFELRDPAFASLWPKVCARHQDRFGDRRAEEITLGGP